MKKIILSAFAISALSLVSCNTDFERDVNNMTVSTGKADFSKFVSVGNSLTSGFRDGALYLDGQNESFPSMLAKQMALAGGTQTFTQPLMPNNVGGFTNITGFGGKYTLQLVDVKDASGSVVGKKLAPVQSTAAATLDIIGGTGKYFNNMGVPGAKSYHLVASGYGSAVNLSLGKANPYFVRFATSATTSVLADAMAQKPSFYTLWIGNNDVLSYATSGGLGVDQKGNLDPSTYGSNDITDPNVVASVIKNVILGLKSANANSKGAIANIPYVTSIPYFTAVPYNPVPLSSASASTLNTSFSAINAKLKSVGMAERFSTLTASTSNPVLIIDKSLTDISAYLPAQYAIYGQARHATANDLILLPASSVIGIDPTTGLPPTSTSTKINGVTIPLADQLVLTEKEAAKVIAATDAYNASISSLATANGLALVDANAKMKELGTTSGIQYNGVKYTASFITGGTFSLDGVHPNGRGYAIIANTFIKAINNTYFSTLPFVDINAYSGVTFP